MSTMSVKYFVSINFARNSHTVQRGSVIIYFSTYRYMPDNPEQNIECRAS